MKNLATFWLVIGAIVGATLAVVGGTFIALSPFMSTKAIGFAWCGAMVVGVVIFCSWLIYEDHNTESGRE